MPSPLKVALQIQTMALVGREQPALRAAIVSPAPWGLPSPWPASNDASAPAPLFLLCLQLGPTFRSILHLPRQLESGGKGIPGLGPHVPPKLLKKSPRQKQKEPAQLWERKKHLVSESHTKAPATPLLS